MKKIKIIFLLVICLIASSVGTVAGSVTDEIRRGDILLFGCPAIGPDDEGYSTQAGIFFSQAAARESGIYLPFWGDLSTLDDKEFPMGKRYFWGHIEIAPEDRFKPACLEGLEEREVAQTMIILRPTELLRTVVDMDACLRGYQDLLTMYTGYSQPIFGIWLKWIMWGKKNISWFDQPDLFWKWNEIFKVNFNELPAPVFMQYSPHLSDEDYTDIENDKFKERDVDCSSVVGHSLLLGCYKRFPKKVRAFFLNNTAAIAAIDSAAPGNLAWWLYESGFVDIIRFPPQSYNGFKRKVTINFLINQFRLQMEERRTLCTKR